MARSNRQAELKKDLDAKLHLLAGEQQERLAQRRADQLDLPYMNLMTFPIDQGVLESVSQAAAQRAQAVLFYRRGGDVRVGVVDPRHPAFAEFLVAAEQLTGKPPVIHIVSPRSIQWALARYRRIGLPEEESAAVAVTAQELAEFEGDIQTLHDLGAQVEKLSPTELLSTIVAGAVKVGASDIHIEPAEHDARLRYRIDGVLQDVTTFARTGWRLLLSRIKVLSRLKLNVRDLPQDGSFQLNVAGSMYDVRVSTLPGGAGENIVMRVLSRQAQVVLIPELGMKDRDEKVIQKELKRSNGLFLVTGPTGSGKTTSLASFLSAVVVPELKVITLEDPIEYRLTGVEQTQVDTRAGYTFAKGLRAILRQDPDIIMVGEIRDAETAEVAVHAALTGHLVFSTLHTNDAPGAVPRLMDLGVRPNVLAPAVNVIIAQRLVRIVCQECAEEYRPDEELWEHILEVMRGVRPEVFDPTTVRTAQLRLRRAKGCSACQGVGYRGRIGLFEVMPVEGEVEELILAGAPGNRIQAAALVAGMTTIQQDGYLKVLEGVTTLEEIARVTEE